MLIQTYDASFKNAIYYLPIFEYASIIISLGLREEENSDRPDDYVIKLLGQNGPVSEVYVQRYNSCLYLDR